jgi:hypothetical protein
MFLCSCGRHSPEDYKEEGQQLSLSLIKVFSRIHSYEELTTASPDLKRLFDQLATICIEAQQQMARDGIVEPLELSEKEQQVNARLRLELQRICKIEGCRDLVEKCQEEAMTRLDAHLQRNNVWKKNL